MCNYVYKYLWYVFLYVYRMEGRRMLMHCVVLLLVIVCRVYNAKKRLTWKRSRFLLFYLLEEYRVNNNQ